MSIPQASTYLGVHTDQHPSFDTLDQMIAWEKDQGATHMSLSNYHGGAFWKANNPTAKKSWCSIMHFGYRYDIEGLYADSNTRFIDLPNAGWYSTGVWYMADTYELAPHGLAPLSHPWFPIDYRDNDYLVRYLESMRECHDLGRSMAAKLAQMKQDRGAI